MAKAARRRRPILRYTAIAATAVLLPAVAYSIWAVSRDYEMSSALEIEATADEVWAVLADRESYPRWNPFIVSSAGDLVEGGTLTNELIDTNGGSMTFTPTVLTVEPGRELRWKGSVVLPGIFDGEHWFTIEPAGDGRVVLHQEERFSGIAVPPMIGSIRETTLPMFDRMNEALAAEVSRRR
ncbi:MAG: SRPBCC domain-containing protein [Streptomyces sp.]|nr:SRPBCC domain-containing protein [Streptomyces sp.]